MPEIATIEEARKLREKLKEAAKEWHERVAKYRKLIDRLDTDELEALGKSLPEKLQDKWNPYQAPDADAEIEDISALLASNDPDLEVIARRIDAKIATPLQKLEDALTAFYQYKWPIELRQQRYEGVLGVGITIHAWDKLAPGPNIAKYANRQELESYAEDATEVDESDDAPKAKYARAYGKAKGDTPEMRHRNAYLAVTNEALAEDGARWRHRLVDPENFCCFLEKGPVPDVIIGMEDEEVEVNPVLEALEGYGVRQQGTDLVLAKDTRQITDPALGGQSEPYTATGSCTIGQDGKVRYTQIRTRDQIIVIVEGLKANDETRPDAGAIFLRLPSPYPATNRRTGYYIVPGRTKLRGKMALRFEPVILPLLVEMQIFNEITSARLAMAWAEASREEVELDNGPGTPPYDDTQQRKVTGVPTNTAPRPLASGEVKRVETTGIDMAQMASDHLGRMERFRSKEFFSGSGSASESGRHLADTQTAQLTKLSPIQEKCAAVDKRMLMDILSVHAATGEPLFVPVMPSTPKAERGDKIQMAEPLEITGEMARLPYELRITIGADTPQGQWARQQVSREEVNFGTYGLTEHREIVGVRNPQETVRRMAIDSLVRVVLGTAQQPGLATARLATLIDQRAQQIVDAIMPPPPAPAGPAEGTEPQPGELTEPPNVEGTEGTPASGSGAGGAYVPPAVPGGPAGVPDVATAGAGVA